MGVPKNIIDTCLFCESGKFKKNHKTGICCLFPFAEKKKVIEKTFKACEKFSRIDQEKQKRHKLHLVEQEIDMAMMEQYNNQIQRIQREIRSSASSYIIIGLRLWEAKHGCYLKAGGHPDVYDFGLKVFGWEKTYVKNLIKVCERFSVWVGKTPGYQINLRWENFEFTKLVELLPLSDEQINTAGITPEWTIKQIRNFKKSAKNEDCSGQTSDQNGDEEENFKATKKTPGGYVLKTFDEFNQPAIRDYIKLQYKQGYMLKLTFVKEGEE